MYGASEGLRTVLVERTATGGQAGQSSRIENYLGFPDGVSGAQLTERARRQAAKFGAEFITTREVVGIEVNGSARTVRFADGATHRRAHRHPGHRRVLPAAGRHRAVDDLTGRGVYYGSAMTEAANCADQDVYIVGGANSAGQAAVYLARGARSVTILVRAPSLEASMSYYLIQQIAAVPNITVRTCTEVVAAQRRRAPGAAHAARQRDRARPRRSTPQWLFVFIGAAPRTDWLDGVVLRDERRVRRRRSGSAAGAARGREAGPSTARRTTWRPACPGVFVAGDARAESAKRVASAVGEGAMAVMLVHRYLEKRMTCDRLVATIALEC